VELEERGICIRVGIYPLRKQLNYVPTLRYAEVRQGGGVAFGACKLRKEEWKVKQGVLMLRAAG
jgi:hypothetical protein